MASAFTAGEGALWIQPNGLGFAPAYLGCHGVGDVAEPQGDITLLYCPDEKASRKFKVTGSFQAAAGAVTTTITTKIQDTADYLELVNCPTFLYVVKMHTGRRDIFVNYDRIYVFPFVTVTNRGLSALLAMSPEEEGESQQTFDLSAQGLIRLWKVRGDRQTIAETEGVNSISFCDDSQCAGSAGPQINACTNGWAGTDPLAASAANVANVLYTNDGGGTWAATSANPFGGSEAIASVRCFVRTPTSQRVFAVRGTTDAGNPAEIAYSDNAGAAWTNVNVGSTNGQFAEGNRSLQVVDQYNVWLVTSGGYIYKSEDLGVTWTTKNAGVASSGADLYAIYFMDTLNGISVGETNTILRTSDGGTTWSVISGPAAEAANIAMCAWMTDENTAFVGYSSGTIYRCGNFQDATPDWTQKSLGVTLTTVNDIAFDSPNVGYAAGNAAGPVGHVFRTWDGGHTWEDIQITTNTGLNALHVCSTNIAFTGGDITSSAGFIAKIS